MRGVKMIFFISDLHLGHSNIFKYEPTRQTTFGSHKNFIKEIIKRWNSVVKKNDIVYNLGDFIVGFNQMKRDLNLSISEKDFAKSIMNTLNGRKILILGNHDKKSIQFYKEIGFDDVKHFDYIEYNNKIIFLFHYPLCYEYLKKEPQLKEIRNEINDKVDLIIHGHVHSNVWCQNCSIPHFNASVENIDFRPISLQEILEKLKIN
jgi:calcineurin-like phosphoesterase family protein